MVAWEGTFHPGVWPLNFRRGCPGRQILPRLDEVLPVQGDKMHAYEMHAYEIETHIYKYEMHGWRR
jgi:hypothetical protein